MGRLEHEGMRLVLGLPSTAADSGAIPAGRPSSVDIEVAPIDASNSVALTYRINGGHPQTVAARWRSNDLLARTQRFVAPLPAFQAGDHVQYAAAATCAGSRVTAGPNPPAVVVFDIDDEPSTPPAPPVGLTLGDLDPERSTKPDDPCGFYERQDTGLRLDALIRSPLDPTLGDAPVPAPTRGPLLAQAQAVDYWRDVNDSQSAYQFYLQAQTLAPNPAPAPEDAMANAWAAAMDSLKGIGGELAEFPGTAARTIGARPKEFGSGTWTGICAYVESEIDNYKQIAGDVGGFFGNLGGCLKQTFLSGPDDVAQGDPCKQFRDIGESIQSLVSLAQKIWNLTFAELLDMMKKLLDFVIKVFREFLAKLRELLAGWKDEVVKWLRETATDAIQLGEIAGSLVASVAIEWLTGGVGRAMKSARGMQQLAKYPDVFDAAPNLRNVTEPAHVAVPEMAFRKNRPKLKSPEDIFQRLAAAFEEVLRTNKLELNRNLTLDKVAALNRALDKGTLPGKRAAAALREFKKNRAAMGKHLDLEFGKLSGAINRHGANGPLEAPFNRKVTTYELAQALVDDKPGAVHPLDVIRGRKEAMVPRLLQSNHIFESRIFDRTRSQYAPEYEKLGWTGRNSMPAIIMSDADHNGSVRRILRREGVPEECIDWLGPVVVESFSKVLQRRIAVQGQPNIPPKAFVITSKTPFSAVLNKYEELFADPQVVPPKYGKAMITEIKKWRRQLKIP